MVASKRALTLGAAALCCASALFAAACGGGSSTGTIPNNPPPTATPPAPSPTPSISAGADTIVTSQGAIIGLDDQFTPADGDTANPSAGHGQPVDGITCDTTMSGNYHIHVYLGIYVNGTRYAMPDTVGMLNPVAEPAGGFTDGAQCFYWVHTHDASGIVHVETPNAGGAPVTASIMNLKNVLDVWGIAANTTHVGQFSGPVAVFTSGQVYRGSSNNGLVSSTMYTQYNGDLNTIPLFSHEVIWLLVGPTFPASLPNVMFYPQF
ncbi:MAG: hypothetical protein DLM53_00125 [Candidatus Eremiobacter antarcticus]|nr:MAG: hypothetical protein DLM53_00125 [Candidatus Eremiobacter sp. RRmetagenome_bin22]